MKALGRTRWAIAGGYLPLECNGPEPAFTSRDQLSLLNVADEEAQVEVTLYYAGRPPVGPYKVTVPARRLRKVRCNDLIDPEAPPLDTGYAAVIRANVPVVVQCSRLDSRQAENAIMGTVAFAGEE
jgi:hypothetical protein